MALRLFIQGVLNYTETIPNVEPLHVRVWNNQVQGMIDQSIQAIPLPAVFVEFVFNGGGHDAEYLTARDMTVRFHIVTELLNTEGSFEQNMKIYDLRDLILQYFTKWHVDTAGLPFNFTPFQLVGEQPQYDHTNLYEYVIEFSTYFSQALGTAQQIQQTQGTFTDLIIHPSKL